MEHTKEAVRERFIAGNGSSKEGSEKFRPEENGQDGKEEGNKSYIFYQTMTALSVGLGGLVASVAMGYTSPALPSMRADPSISITQEQESWVGAVMPATALIGSLIAGPLVDRFGRRTTLLHLTWPFFLSWAMIATSNGVGGVVVGRMLSGVCVGVQAVAGSVLMPEMVQLDLRNILALFPALFGTFGLMLGFWAGQHLMWRGLAWLGAFLCLPLVPLLVLLPETPHFLTASGQREKSVSALLLLRRSPREAREEQRVVDKSVQDGKEAGVSLAQVVAEPNLWPVAVASGLMVAQQTTGITAVVFFASTILGDSGGDVILGVVNFIGTFVGMAGVATTQRRKLLLFSSCVVISALVILGIHFWTVEDEVTGLMRLVPAGALVAYMLGFSLGWGPVPWVFLGEGMPSAVRGKAAAGVVAVNWGSAFIVTKTFGWSLAALGPHTTFLSYAIFTVLAMILLYPAMPETYMQSTAAMDKLYQDTAAKKRQ